MSHGDKNEHRTAIQNGMDLSDVMLSKSSHVQKGTFHTSPLILGEANPILTDKSQHKVYLGGGPLTIWKKHKLLNKTCAGKGMITLGHILLKHALQIPMSRVENFFSSQVTQRTATRSLWKTQALHTPSKSGVGLWFL